MNLITGCFKHTRKIKAMDCGRISEVYISNVLEHNEPDEYLVSDGNGRIPVFRCVGSADKAEFEGYLKYRLGNLNMKFRFAEGLEGGTSILMNGKHFHVCAEESDVPTKYLIFSEGALKEKEAGSSEVLGEIEEEFGRCESEAHRQVVLSFLGSIRPQHHAQFLYFYVSNVEAIYGQVLVSCVGSTMVLHTLTSPVFLNFNELFSSGVSLPMVYGIPYFPHTNFIVSCEWRKIYESRAYGHIWSYPRKFLLKVLSLILLEERIVFYSAKSSSLRVLQIMELIKPFRWPHIICLPLLPGMEEILESPLPFVTCLDRKLKAGDVVFVDLDDLKIHSSKRQALLPNKKAKDTAAQGHMEEMKDCIEMIATEILLWREYLIKRHGSRVIAKMPNNPLEFTRKARGFYSDFFRTRMFLAFITEEHDHLCRYLVEIGRDYSVILLPYAQLGAHMYTKALRLWIELFDGDMEPMVEHLVKNGVLEDVADMIFKGLSYREDYDKIDTLLSCISSPTHEMYMNINVVSRMPRVVFRDLYSYKVYHLRACDCKALDLGGLQCQESSRWGEKGNSMEAVRSEIRKLLGGMKQDFFDLEKEDCGCTVRNSVVLAAGPGYSFLCFLLVPENIDTVLKHCGSKDLLEKSPQAYWSIVTYFLYFNLPLGNDPAFDGKVDVIIDEPALDLRIDGRPKFYFDP
ncbi:CYCLIN B-LIKE GUANINE NUCLEOTIDE BINDING PROTEIN [Encephalitozoon cuniculi GB-M1]|uniref:CYCLIN B-LIKE GUANINE NUCLEOTIDE BINDING PROTEIN n=1 Tax=Encephalitozoon cuniculi (strain GB-M1) TaxID=284813 RepID=Q8SS14_ENCCU|nr:uncharacterized protein ECU04_1460 [Encephalitozoon cuniculi GB-M1]CAD25335.1 CYCLIN B-LIKE GUANINE NUCLEOTIDE BINDING PROTEIN [Encephalitozoon cuniculi GB-M1]